MSGRDRERRRSPRRERQRHRSVSPPRGGRNRSPRRNRNDDRFDRRSRGYEGRRRGGDEHRGGGRGRSPHRGDHGSEPLPYKQFILRLPDNILPADAEKAYQEYLASFWGSEARREFEHRKDEPALRERFDPREIAKLKEKRAARVAEAAQAFLEELKAGRMDLNAENFNQGTAVESAVEAVKEEEDTDMGDKEAAEEEEEKPEEVKTEGEQEKGSPKQAEDEVEKKGEENGEPAGKETKPKDRKVAPASAWVAERIKEDLNLAQQLIKAADAEMGITESNPLVGQTQAEEAEPKEGGATEAGTKDSGDAAEAMEEEKGEGDAGEGAEGGQEGRSSPTVVPEDPVAHLDLALTYLWRVHDIDYYGGKEYVEELPAAKAEEKPKQRVLRGAKPVEEDEAELSPSAEEFGKEMESAWKARADGTSSPFERLLRSAWVTEQLEEWIDSQITMISESKWGCKLSSKLFVAREYVRKHVRGKHGHLVAAEKEKLLDAVYMKNFLEEMEKNAPPSGGRGADGGDRGAEGGPGRMDGGWGPHRMHHHGGGGRGPRGPMMGRGGGGHMGRGGAGYMGAGGPMGRGGMGPMGPMGMGGMGPMGPMAGGVLVPAPGAGPLGPFIMAPGPGMGGMGFMGGMGMGGGRGQGGYVDLDAPRNNRAVLDYGDL